jgi:hypothetical protein
MATSSCGYLVVLKGVRAIAVALPTQAEVGDRRILYLAVALTPAPVPLPERSSNVTR